MVVIADDDEGVRSFLQACLRREGFRTLLATNGREAVDLVRREDVGILLMDVQMPVLDGLQALREIRADDRGHVLPIILITGLDDASERIRGLEGGGDDFLVKPVSVRELIARVRAHVRGRTAWADERGRVRRRRLAATIEGFPSEMPFELLATTLAEQLPVALDVDAVAILHFTRNSVRCIASTGDFRVVFRPIVRLDDGAVIAVEALTRFDDGVPPNLRFAEAAGLGQGAALERATLWAAIEAARTLPDDVALSVNLSADVLEHESALPKIMATADRRVIVELTEHERVDDYDALRSALGRLGDNVLLAVDDAGSGYASLRHILALQPTYVKLDIEWVHGLDRDPVRRALVSGLIYFASETGCQLIAEGIETDEELQVLRRLGIVLGQGYLLGRPQPAGPS